MTVNPVTFDGGVVSGGVIDESMCKSYQLDWSWVEDQLTKLANQGVIIFPRPWSVQLVQTTEKKEDEITSQRDVTDEILAFLRSQGGLAEIRQTR